jgi:hypothetical protein
MDYVRPQEKIGKNEGKRSDCCEELKKVLPLTGLLGSLVHISKKLDRIGQALVNHIF